MNALNKKMMRSMWKTRGQVLAVVAVVLCGTACYICMASLHRNLLLTRDTYYAQNRFADFEIQLERAPSSVRYKIEELQGVRQVRSRIVEDVKVEIDGVTESRSGRLVSMPQRRKPVINNVVVTRGRYFEPEARNEVVISEKFAIANALELGDYLKVTVDGKQHALKLVGYGLSPEYIYVIRNVQEMVPAPERFGIFWVPEHFAEDALNMQESCNNLVGRAESEEQVDAILDEAEKLLDGYGVFSKVARENQVSHQFITSEIQGLGVQAKVLPSVFMSIAALIIFILLNRMVRNERTQIGLMKAYGYSSRAVGLHYATFAVILALAGSVAGSVVGQWLARGLIQIYIEFYSFPILRSRVYPDVLARSVGITLVFSLVGAFVAARRAARIQPAESMRPEAPAGFATTPLERVGVIWRRLSFTWKMIARNVARNRFRASLNVLGVVVSCLLLTIGMFSMTGMEYIIDFQYVRTQKQDATVSFWAERGKDALYEASRFPNVLAAEPVLNYPFTMTSGWRSKDVLIVGMPRDAKLQRLIDTDENIVDIGDHGLVLSKALAERMHVGAGDIVRLKPLMGRIDKEKEVPVSKVVAQYFGMSGYMNIEALSRVLDEPFALNSVLLKMEPGTGDALHKELKDVPMVTSVAMKADAVKSIRETIQQSMWIMSVTVVLFAGIISFSIIYNVTMVSLQERARELASLRVMGFTKQEVGRVLYFENFLMGAIGLILGVPIGIGACRLLVNAFDTDMFRFPFYIAPTTPLYAVLFSVTFIAIANAVVRRKINGLVMVDVLKARE